MRHIFASVAGLAAFAASAGTTPGHSSLAIGLSVVVAVCCAILGWIVAGWLELEAVRRGVLHVATRTSRATFTHIVSLEDTEGRQSERGFTAICGQEHRAWSLADQRWAARANGPARAAIYTARNSWRGPHKDVLVGWVDQHGHHNATAPAPHEKETFTCSDR
jgi:hypothetical protein